MSAKNESIPISTESFQAAHLVQIDLSYLQRCISFLIQSSEDHSSFLHVLERKEESLSGRADVLETEVKELQGLQQRDDARIAELEKTAVTHSHLLNDFAVDLEALRSDTTRSLSELNAKLEAQVEKLADEMTKMREEQEESFSLLRKETSSMKIKMKEMEEENEREKEETARQFASMKETFDTQLSILEEQLRLTSERAEKAEKMSEDAAAGVKLAQEAAAAAAAQAAAVAQQIEEANKLSYVHQIEREKIIERLDTASSLTEETAAGLSSQGHDDWAGNLQQAMASMVSAWQVSGCCDPHFSACKGHHWQVSEQRLTALHDKVEGIDMMVKVQNIEGREPGEYEESRGQQPAEKQEERIDLESQEETRRIEQSMPAKTGAVFRQIIEAHGSLTKRKADKAEFDTLCGKVQELDLFVKQLRRSERAGSQKMLAALGDQQKLPQDDDISRITNELENTSTSLSRLVLRVQELEGAALTGTMQVPLNFESWSESNVQDAKAGQEEVKAVRGELDQIRKHLFGFALSGTSVQHETASKPLADASTSTRWQDAAEQTEPEEKEEEEKQEEKEAQAMRVAQLEHKKWTRSGLRVATTTSSSSTHLTSAHDDLKRYEMEKRPRTSATELRRALVEAVATPRHRPEAGPGLVAPDSRKSSTPKVVKSPAFALIAGLRDDEDGAWAPLETLPPPLYPLPQPYPDSSPSSSPARREGSEGRSMKESRARYLKSRE
ncbi:hypothetical protein GUITHDRAFT_112998 [Guillardia theta CCMP2712]|uniref:Uncharacterized protein n=1 Tax=Guillardia theta (strain CCMP2712) TaxID=905079 RepID=L1IYU1_GUITC|nr:hypothetical protein GUITHDRAFT_112998 [Guillardia theta CCMP2712]EKX40995.1 hypothetical protein GUITHDRAFT_112998 [Guillardia theta CCMP2712]|eukprot:XP_005827975.1 hypothetical protein GUITHDRAFT_112998 [Guillardia theta CCMP2712]